MKRESVLIVFAKAPRAGQVKTRLAASIGAEAALAVYRALAEGLWADWRRGQASGAFQLWLCFDPPEAEAGMRTWLPGADRYLPQVAGNLGHRLAAALETAFEAGFAAVSVVGTDAPAAKTSRVVQGLSTVEPGSVVFGPCVDGGFYLMALTPSTIKLDALLDAAPWSSEATLGELCHGLRALGFDIHLLPEARDIDTLEDLEAHRNSNEGVGFPL